MVQKLRGPRSIWLLAILAALVASVHASSIQLNRSTYKGCIDQCTKSNHLYQGSKFGISRLFRRSNGYHKQISANYELGKTYTYEVRVSTESLTKFAQDQANQENAKRDQLIAFEATALLTPISECEVSLQLTKLNIDNAHQLSTMERQRVQQELERPILFGYQDGIVSSLCLDKDEQSEYALNIKKSIISALQTTPDLSITDELKVKESDLSGECPTEYKVQSKSGGKYIVYKRKNLAACENPLESMSTYSNWKNAMLKHVSEDKSVAQCEQHIQEGYLSKVHCQSIRPVPTFVPHIQTMLISNVELKDANVVSTDRLSAQVPRKALPHPHRLLMASPYGAENNQIFGAEYANEKSITPLSNGKQQLKQVLSDLCDDLKRNNDRVTLETPKFVHQLANLIRRASQEETEFVWKNIVQTGGVCTPENAKKVRDIFVDTAASVMNTSAAKIVRDELIKYIEVAKQNQQQPEGKQALKRARYLATLVAFAYEPTIEAVSQVVPELIEKTDDAQIVLSLSALVKKIQWIPHQQQEEQQWVESLYETILAKVQQSLDKEIEAVRLLAALQNIRPRTVIVRAQQQLVKLFSDKRTFTSVRIAAIRTLAHLELPEQTRQAILRAFSDRVETNELRIAAYRTLVQSGATTQELQQILTTIEAEKQNEDVRNYVCSHQKNLRTTKDPVKRALLPLRAPLFPEPESLMNVFVSRSFEYSTINPKSQVGVIVETDVVMEKDSRVPRLAIFNLTVPVAQHQVPIVELVIRQEGLEQSILDRLEKVKQLSPKRILSELQKWVKQIAGQQKYESEQHNKHHEHNHAAGKLQLWLNQDGKNLYIWDSAECEHFQEHSLEQLETVFGMLYKQLPIRIDETAVVMPLKHRVRLPTTSGIPINFELNTTLIASLEATFKGLKQGATNQQLEMHLKPTLIAELGIGLEADLEYENQKAKRVQFVNRFITAPTLHIKLQKKTAEGQYQIEFQTPEDEQILARFETQFHQDQNQEAVLGAIANDLNLKDEIKAIIRQQRQPTFYRSSSKSQMEKCVPYLEQTLGLTYCFRQFTVQDLEQALNTRDSDKLIYRSEIRMVKTDKSMKSIKLAVKIPQWDSQDQYSSKNLSNEIQYEFFYDTPGSQGNRRVSFKGTLIFPETKQGHYFVEMKMETPEKKMSGYVAVDSQSDKKGIKVEFTIDGQRQFLIDAQAALVANADENKQVKLRFHLQPSPSTQVIQMEGEFVLNGLTGQKQNLALKLKLNEQQMLELALIKQGSLFKPEDVKLSTTLKVNLLGANIDSNVLLTKSHQTGTIKSKGTIKYNRFLAFSRRARNTMEGIEFSAQYSGLNQPSIIESIHNQQPTKKFIHWTVQSTQFARLNHELTYNIQGVVPAEFDQELTLKWQMNGEEQRVHALQHSKLLQNVRTRSNVKHQTKLELEITPLDVNYDAQLVMDLPSEQQRVQKLFPQNYGFELKAHNRQTDMTDLEARAAFALRSYKPLDAEIKLEAQLKNGQHVFKYEEQIKEVNAGTLVGATTISMPTNQHVQKVDIKYKCQHLVNPTRRTSLRFTVLPMLNLIPEAINSMEKFEHEMVIESSRYGDSRHELVISADQQTNEWEVKAQLDRKQQPYYKAELEFKPQQQRLIKAKFETIKFDQLRVQFEAQRSADLKKVELTVENARLQHRTKIHLDQAQAFYEVACETKKDQKVIFELLAKTEQNKSALVKVHSRVIEAKFEVDNLSPAMIKSIIEERSIEFNRPNEESRVRAIIKLPTKQVEHNTEIKIQPAARKLTLVSNTRKEEKNLFKVELELNPQVKNLSAEYKQGYTAQVKLAKDVQEQNIYELLVDYQIAHKRVAHKTQAKWWFNKNQTQLRHIFRLISLDMKNHFGPEHVYDITYRTNQEQRSIELILSARDSHAELRVSKRAPVAVLFTFKSKKFGGVAHKTELTQVDAHERTLKLNSNTVRRGETILKVEADLAARKDRKSSLKIELPKETRAEIQVVPFQWIEGQVEYRNQWKHQARAERNAEQRQWSVKVNSVDLKQNEQWNVKAEHQCDQFTTLEIDTPVLKGTIALRFPNHSKYSAIVDLKGERKLAGNLLKMTFEFDPETNFFRFNSSGLYRHQALEVEAQHGKDKIIASIEAPELKFRLTIVPKQVEIESVIRKYRHVAVVKRHSKYEVTANWETRKDGQVAITGELELSKQKMEVKAESTGIVAEVTPFTVQGKLDIVDREIHAKVHNKRTDRLVKFDAELKDLKNAKVEIKWDAIRDQTKQVVIQLRIQDREQDPQRFVASIVGDIVNRPFEVKVDFGRNLRALENGNQIEAQLNDRNTETEYKLKAGRICNQQEGKECKAWCEVRKNQFTLIKGDIKFESQKGSSQRKQLTVTIESDTKIDLLNVKFDLERECQHSPRQCQTKANAVYGAEEKKQLKFEATNKAEFFRGELVVDLPTSRGQTIKFEYMKQEPKLQVNVFNQEGRQLDLNVDIARPLQKKFQLESFIPQVPNVDIEWARGENSRFVVLVDSKKEQKLELSLNWFGQWRRDFKLEALFKCFAKPSVELMINSRHPAASDEIDAMLKVNGEQYALKWVRKFDPAQPRHNWTTRTIVTVNGDKKIDLNIDCAHQQLDNNREKKSIKIELNGSLKQISAKLNLITRGPIRSLASIESVQAELSNQKHDRLASFELHLEAITAENAILTGAKLTLKDRTIFGLTYLTNDREGNRSTGLIRLELPGEIEYVIRNEIEYHSNSDEIRSIRWEVKRKHHSAQPIYQTRLIFGEDRDRDLKMVRLEVFSDRFEDDSKTNGGRPAVKVIEVRYNFAPRHCHTLEATRDQQQNLTPDQDRTKCWRMNVLAGRQNIDQQQQQSSNKFLSDNQFDLNIGAEYVKYPITGKHSNRTVRFTIRSDKPKFVEQNELARMLWQPIDLSMIAHASVRSAGVQWENHNRNGQQQAGMVMIEKRPLDNGHSLVNIVVHYVNRLVTDQGVHFDIHFVPQQLRKSFRVAAKYDPARLRRWIVDGMPRIESIAKSHNIKNRIIREIADEMDHKMNYISQYYHEELVKPVVEEMRAVQKQLAESEDQIVKEVKQALERIAAKLAELKDAVDVERIFEEIASIWNESVAKITREVKHYLTAQCQRSELCTELVDQIRDYKIEKFFQDKVVKRMAILGEKVKRAMPAKLVRSIEQVKDEFIKLHQEGYDCEEEEDFEDNNSNNEDEEYNRKSSNVHRHIARLLKMAQPEVSEYMFTQYATLKPKHGNQQQPLSDAEVRAKVHDALFALYDEMDTKVTQQKKDGKPFWSKFMGGQAYTADQADKYQVGAGKQYLKQQWSQWGKKNNQSQQDQDQPQVQKKNNWLLDPKRGEFQFGASTDNDFSSSWTRA